MSEPTDRRGMLIPSSELLESLGREGFALRKAMREGAPPVSIFKPYHEMAAKVIGAGHDIYLSPHNLFYFALAQSSIVSLAVDWLAVRLKDDPGHFIQTSDMIQPEFETGEITAMPIDIMMLQDALAAAAKSLGRPAPALARPETGMAAAAADEALWRMALDLTFGQAAHFWHMLDARRARDALDLPATAAQRGFETGLPAADDPPPAPRWPALTPAAERRQARRILEAEYDRMVNFRRQLQQSTADLFLVARACPSFEGLAVIHEWWGEMMDCGRMKLRVSEPQRMVEEAPQLAAMRFRPTHHGAGLSSWLLAWIRGGHGYETFERRPEPPQPDGALADAQGYRVIGG